MNRQDTAQLIKYLIILIVVLWVVFLITTVFPGLKSLGIQPRTVSGLTGILISPFIHSGFFHLITNTTGIFVLGIVFLFLKGVRPKVLLAFYLLSGFGTWLIGRSGAVHIGASGIIYSLLGYLLTIGIFTRKFTAIIASLIVLFLYGGAVWGMIPLIGPSYISWEAHLSGFVVGVIVARMDANAIMESQ